MKSSTKEGFYKSRKFGTQMIIMTVVVVIFIVVQYVKYKKDSAMDVWHGAILNLADHRANHR